MTFGLIIAATLKPSNFNTAEKKISTKERTELHIQFSFKNSNVHMFLLTRCFTPLCPKNELVLTDRVRF